MGPVRGLLYSRCVAVDGAAGVADASFILTPLICFASRSTKQFVSAVENVIFLSLIYFLARTRGDILQ